MTHVLQISRRAEYALRAALHLARLPIGQRVSFRDVAEREDVPPEFLAKILRTLVDAGLAGSTRGPGGGFALAKSPQEISFLDVIEAAEGPIALNRCCEAGTGCDKAGDCSLESVWRRGEQAMLDVFRATMLGGLVGVPTSPAPTLPVPRVIDAPPETTPVRRTGACMLPASVVEMIEST